MALFLISYDLHNRRNYQPLWDALKGVGAHKALESLWLVNLNNTAQQVLDWISEFGDSDDSFFVTIVSKNTTARLRNNAGTTEWLNSN